MKSEESQPQDITGLFRKFGGDPHAYKEFERPTPEAAAWPLLAQPAATAPGEPTRAQPTSASAVAPFALHSPAQSPSVPPKRSVSTALRSGPSADAHVSAAAVSPSADVGGRRELDVIFDRLLGVAVPAAAVGHGLLARWRSSP